MPQETVPSLLTSVVVAAVVASVVSGIFTSVTMIVERRARRREMIFSKALELAKLKVDYLKSYFESTGKRTFIADVAEYAEWYYGILNTLHAAGHLPKNWEEDYEKRFSGRN